MEVMDREKLDCYLVEDVTFSAGQITLDLIT